ncbi:MAG: hypothetical protein HYW50_00395 [Candidatus Diapherotrites archaeon]|nr:hypothetical protein [Candidatus Diapherotrites archaeon]
MGFRLVEDEELDRRVNVLIHKIALSCEESGLTTSEVLLALKLLENEVLASCKIGER